MSSVRHCDARCHDARGVTCACWCGGLFHGPNAEPARAAFRREYLDDVPPVPPEEPVQGELFGNAPARFTRALAAAREACGQATALH